jgi:hypothetical protein
VLQFDLNFVNGFSLGILNFKSKGNIVFSLVLQVDLMKNLILTLNHTVIRPRGSRPLRLKY